MTAITIDGGCITKTSLFVKKGSNLIMPELISSLNVLDKFNSSVELSKRQKVPDD